MFTVTGNGKSAEVNGEKVTIHNSACDSVFILNAPSAKSAIAAAFESVEGYSYILTDGRESELFFGYPIGIVAIYPNLGIAYTEMGRVDGGTRENIATKIINRYLGTEGMEFLA